MIEWEEYMFSTETNGYKKTEVEVKITELENMVAKLMRTCQEKDTVNIKLATAVEKANQIESSSKNLMYLNFKKFMVIYKSFEQAFANLFRNYPQLESISVLKNILIKFKADVNSIMGTEIDSDCSINALVKTENDTIRLLLNKMSNYAKAKPISNDYIKSDKIKRREPEKIHKPQSEKIKQQAERIRTVESSTQIRPISNLTLKNDENYETIADKFLENDDDANAGSAYAQIISKTRKCSSAPNESGFDLKEAVNPKEDLSTIMKSFNFN